MSLRTNNYVISSTAPVLESSALDFEGFLTGENASLEANYGFEPVYDDPVILQRCSNHTGIPLPFRVFEYIGILQLPSNRLIYVGIRDAMAYVQFCHVAAPVAAAMTS